MCCYDDPLPYTPIPPSPRSFQVYDGGGATDSASAGPRPKQWVTGQLPVVHLSDPESRETESGLRTTTTAESAGEKRHQPEGGGLGRDLNEWSDVPSMLDATMGPSAESKEAMGPEKKSEALSEGRVFNGIPRGSTTWNILHPQRVQGPDDSAAAPGEAVGMATMESQAVGMATVESQALSCESDEASYTTLNELVFPLAARKNGRLVSCPVASVANAGLGFDYELQQRVDKSLQHALQPFSNPLGTE